MGKGKRKFGNSIKKEDMKSPETEEPEEVFNEVVPKWYEQFKDEKLLEFEPPTEEELQTLRAEAQQALEQETNFYHSKDRKGKSGYDSAWLKTMLTKGTSKDKIAAHIISVQNAPMFNLLQLQSLINMVKPSKQRDCISVMENLTDLFLEDLLIPSRKLKTFEKQPLTKLFDITSGCARARKARLVSWMFEEKLKECYSNFIHAVDGIAKDTVDSNRMKAVTIMNKLLSGHPEHEQLLLTTIVNKLGDPNQKVVSKVIYCLTQLLRVHPNMKQVVMNEVEKFLFRPNLGKRAQYYSICFLTQYIFQQKDRDIARNIISIYFSFFKAAIKKGEVDSKLMGALLVGVKRAHPFAKLTSEVMKEHTDTLYKLVHLTPFNVSIHALCLLQEVATSSDDRFFSALYRKLLDPDIAKSCHQAIFINLLYKAITKDTDLNRVKAVIKRLFQVCLNIPSPLACGLLYLLSQILSKRRQLVSFQTEPRELRTSIKIEESDDDEDEKYFDADNDTNSAPLEIKEDADENDPQNQNSSAIKEESDDDLEVKVKKEPGENNAAEGWVFKNLTKPRKTSGLGDGYDPYARNPAFAHADKTAYFELIGLVRHFHPSVALFAKQILTSERITYSGDPLSDFTLVRFLDRFCFKNPKKLNEDSKGPDPTLAQRKYYKPSGPKSMPVLSQNYLSQDKSRIPVDELFLYKYLKDKHGDGTKFNKKDDDDNDSVASEEFEEMIQGMMGGKNTEELDFLEDVGDKLKKKKGAKDVDDDFSSEGESDIQEEEDEDDESDDEVEGDKGENDEDLIEGDDDALELDEDGANAIEFSDDGSGDDDDIDLDKEFFENDFSTNDKKSKKSKLKNVKKVKGLKMKGGLEGLFAPAEEFSEILEEAGAAKEKPGMIQSMSNTDNADTKQLAWESKRDRWVRNLDQRKRKFNNKSNNKFTGFKKKKKN